LGVVPLVVAEGAGAEMRRTLGIAVFSGMVGVTLFGIFLTPVFFVVIDRLASSSLVNSQAVRSVAAFVLPIIGFELIWMLTGHPLRALAAVLGLCGAFFLVRALAGRRAREKGDRRQEIEEGSQKTEARIQNPDAPPLTTNN
jgi:multidrug efflux pump